MNLRSVVRRIPVVGPKLIRGSAPAFTNSADYWETRYRRGGNSGAGSYNRLAMFKADFLNRFVREQGVETVLEFGSGDGAQLELADYPAYVGIDVAQTVVESCRAKFAGDTRLTFYHSSDAPAGLAADLSLSLDVIYHLVEDDTFEDYMRRLFDGATRFVIVYASNEDRMWPSPHVRHRRFTDWVEMNRPNFVLARHVPNAYPFDERDPDNTSFADFYVFERR